MQFLSSGLLYGLGLAMVPLVIHLLNRRRFQLIDWAPMKYLKLTVRNNRRRVRIEQLLLLLLRTLLMILLVATVARPVFSGSGIGRWLSRRARVSRMIVLDDSLSMGYRQGGRGALEDGKAAAGEILGATGAQDAVTFLTTAPGATPLVHEAAVDDPAQLMAQINALRPTDAACDWAATFKTIDDALATATFPQKQVILITDLRRAGWSGGVSSLANRWAALGVEARVIDVGSRETADVSLAKFVQEDSIALPGNAVKLRATIGNQTPSPLTGAQAVLTVDGQSRPVMLPDLPAGASTDVPMSVTFDSPGQHSLKLSLPDDALAGDNVRFLSVNVRQRLDVTIVDGRQGAGPFESAGDFLQLALTVGPGSWQVAHLGDSDPPAAHADVIVLADSAAISVAAAAEYEKRVRQGMGMMIFAGEQVDPELYNQRLFRNGNGLLPARLDRIADGPVRGLVVEGLGDSPLSPLAKIAPAALAKIQTERLMEVEMSPAADQTVRVLARWNDPEGHPAVIEKRLGRGRVLLWTTSADRQWTNWPVDPTYVLAVRSAAAAVAWPDAGDDNLVAGHPLVLPLNASGPVTEARVTLPDDPTEQPVSALSYPHTERAGVYTFSWTDASGKRQTHQLSASFDEKASDLQPLSESELSDLLGGLKAQITRYQPGALMASAPGREMWRMLASILLGLMVVETIFAFWVGRER